MGPQVPKRQGQALTGVEQRLGLQLGLGLGIREKRVGTRPGDTLGLRLGLGQRLIECGAGIRAGAEVGGEEGPGTQGGWDNRPGRTPTAPARGGSCSLRQVSDLGSSRGTFPSPRSVSTQQWWEPWQGVLGRDSAGPAHLTQLSQPRGSSPPLPSPAAAHPSWASEPWEAPRADILPPGCPA